MKPSVSLLLAIVAITTSLAVSDGVCSFKCPDVKAPVCGSDGVTYSNKCNLYLADCQGNSTITQKADGECPTTSTSIPAGTPGTGDNNADCSLICADVYDPAYDEDGNEYSNECYMLRAKCQKRNGITMFPSINLPVH
ncbi:transmembrane protein with EGF-like and two follistatin-like domains 1 [Phytophthora boehmeriae]|uniref:Transmembrane protein with EGF-like and two follistatin-like domains 1 n=1 Tax=Phytophthora boehmeriae TaxID=109152 RepID=A0A8T1WL47_9STRA|nr:transmembrane protein with EGF-like and two follistatin-like domains 1 [Phytophthora boehmeriae]